MRGHPHRISVVRSRLTAFYPTDEEKDAWLEAPHPRLGGDAPVDRIDMGDWDAVYELLTEIQSGRVV